jgi:hypothetical protein
VTFHEASTALDDPLSLTYDDPDHSTGERRFITAGMSRDRRLLIVAHAERGRNIRIISARKATAHERRHYEEAE